jgi:hypothetical protein
MYDEIYFANMTETDREDERGDESMYFFVAAKTNKGTGHDIGALRLSLMCQANTALYTFERDGSKKKKQHLTSKAQRQCVEWGPIFEWASDRSVGLNPQFYRPKKNVVS